MIDMFCNRNVLDLKRRVIVFAAFGVLMLLPFSGLGQRIDDGIRVYPTEPENLVYDIAELPNGNFIIAAINGIMDPDSVGYDGGSMNLMLVGPSGSLIKQFEKPYQLDYFDNIYLLVPVSADSTIMFGSYSSPSDTAFYGYIFDNELTGFKKRELTFGNNALIFPICDARYDDDIIISGRVYSDVDLRQGFVARYNTNLQLQKLFNIFLSGPASPHLIHVQDDGTIETFFTMVSSISGLSTSNIQLDSSLTPKDTVYYGGAGICFGLCKVNDRVIQAFPGQADSSSLACSGLVVNNDKGVFKNIHLLCASDSTKNYHIGGEPVSAIDSTGIYVTFFTGERIFGNRLSPKERTLMVSKWALVGDYLVEEWRTELGDTANWKPEQTITARNGDAVVVGTHFDPDTATGMNRDVFFLRLNKADGHVTSRPSVRNESEEQMDVFPNPSAGSLKVRLTKKSVYQLQVRDVQGRLVQNDTFNGSETELRLGDAPAGLYLLVVTDQNGEHRHTKRLIIR